jgi:hypothetical protein
MSPMVEEVNNDIAQLFYHRKKYFQSSDCRKKRSKTSYFVSFMIRLVFYIEMSFTRNEQGHMLSDKNDLKQRMTMKPNAFPQSGLLFSSGNKLMRHCN